MAATLAANVSNVSGHQSYKLLYIHKANAFSLTSENQKYIPISYLFSSRGHLGGSAF